MPFFTGEHESRIGAKRRLAISSALREEIFEDDGDQFYLVLGPEGHLWLYPDRYYRRLAQSMKRSILPSQKNRKLSLFFAMARLVRPDGQGRIILPERSVHRAGLENVEQVTLIGEQDHIEIWPRDEWEDYVTQNMPHYSDALYEAAEALEAERGTEAT